MKLTRKQLAAHLIEHPGQQSVSQVAAYLVDNGRSKEMELVVREVEAQLSDTGRTVAHVRSARKLSADQQRDVISMLKANSKTQSVEIINTVDPSLLGGVVVSTPEMEVDLSVRGRLERLKRTV